MKQCDVLVVGGGPAGSTVAWRLGEAGLDVAVMDRQPFPRDKVCAGWITPQVLEALSIDADEYADGRVLQPIHGFRTGMIDGDGEVTTDYRETVSYGIRRCEFDHFLLSRCRAEVLTESLATMTRAGSEWVVNGHVRTPLVIGAGGHFCPVARTIGVKVGGADQAVAAKEIEFEMTPEQAAACPVDPGRPELFFTPDLLGYGWVFRKGNVLNIGLGREDRHHLSEHVEAFIGFLRGRGKLPERIPERLHGHAYLLYRQREPRPLTGDGVLLVGDAAGLAYPQSGEGIRPAVESGLLAADAVLAAGGDYSYEEIELYEQQITARFGERARRDAEWLPDGLKRFVGGRLLNHPGFVRHVVLDRWFLHRHLPPLLTGAPSGHAPMRTAAG